jgi:hypothetical protein
MAGLVVLHCNYSGLLGTGTMSDPYRQASPLPDCLAYQQAYGSSAHDGYYTIAPQGTPFTDLCNMSSANGGWTLLTNQYDAALSGSPRNYLYLLNGDWYESPVTSLVWSWTTGQNLTGTWSYSTGSSTGSFACPTSLETPPFGVGCSTGPGNISKCLPEEPPGCFIYSCQAPDPTTATANVCNGASPNVFGMSNQCPSVQIFERRASSGAADASTADSGTLDGG